MKTTLIKVKLLIKMGSCEKPGNFNPHQFKEIDKIAHQAYNNVDFAPVSAHALPTAFYFKGEL